MQPRPRTKEEIAFIESRAQYHDWLGASMTTGDHLVIQVTSEGVAIEMELTSQTQEEIERHTIPMAASGFKEIFGLREGNCCELLGQGIIVPTVRVRWIIT